MKSNKGMTLVELLIVLAVGSILMGAMLGAFINQQKSYAVQDQVIDMQQGLRAAVDRMTREIRMAGYGGDILETFGNVNTFTHIMTPENGTSQDSITILVSDEVARLSQNAPAGSTQLNLNNSNVFDTSSKRYLCLQGQNNYLIQAVSGNIVTLATPPSRRSPRQRVSGPREGHHLQDRPEYDELGEGREHGGGRPDPR